MAARPLPAPAPVPSAAESEARIAAIFEARARADDEADLARLLVLDRIGEDVAAALAHLREEEPDVEGAEVCLAMIQRRLDALDAPPPAPAAAQVLPFARRASLVADLRAELCAGDPAVIGFAMFLVVVNLAGAAAYLNGWHLS